MRMKKMFVVISRYVIWKRPPQERGSHTPSVIAVLSGPFPKARETWYVIEIVLARKPHRRRKIKPPSARGYSWARS